MLWLYIINYVYNMFQQTSNSFCQNLFQSQIRLNFSCELSATQQMVHMKIPLCLILIASKNSLEICCKIWKCCSSRLKIMWTILARIMLDVFVWDDSHENIKPYLTSENSIEIWEFCLLQISSSALIIKCCWSRLMNSVISDNIEICGDILVQFWYINN